MKFLFLDESGRQNLRAENYFLISGLFVDESSLHSLNNELETYKESLGLKSLKDLRKTRLLLQEEKIRRTKEIFTILDTHSVKILAAILGSTTMGSNTKFEEAYMGALFFLVERFCLQIRPDKGMIFFDKMEGGIQRFIEEKFYLMMQNDQLSMYGKKLANYKDIIYPAISFIKDDFSVILQVSDLISSSINDAVRKSIETNESIRISLLPSLNPYLSIYWPLVVKSFSGKESGWGIKLWD